MEINVAQKFPVIFFELSVSEDVAYGILQEINEKRDQIDLSSKAFMDQKIDCYSSDFHRPVKLHTFENAIKELEVSFIEQHNLKFTLHHYWTAIYMSGGSHSLHSHHEAKFTPFSSGYAGVLYLSGVGGTHFMTERSDTPERNFMYPSKFGNIVMFPSNIMHQYIDCVDDGARFVVPFNFDLVYADGKN